MLYQCFICGPIKVYMFELFARWFIQNLFLIPCEVGGEDHANRPGFMAQIGEAGAFMAQTSTRLACHTCVFKNPIATEFS